MRTTIIIMINDNTMNHIIVHNVEYSGTGNFNNKSIFQHRTNTLVGIIILVSST